MDKRHLLIGLIIILLIAACGGDEVEQTADVVLPTAVIQEATPFGVTEAEATATWQPTAVIFPNTPTPPPVATEAPEPTPTALPPTLIPSDVVVESENRPFISQDLLFVGDGDLRKWSRRDGSVATLLFRRTVGRQELLYGNVHHVAISEDGTVAVAARAIPTDSMNSELWWVDMVFGQTRQLIENVTGLISMALSPDGRSLLYVVSDADNLFRSGTVYRLDLDSGVGATAVGRCTDEPVTIADSPIRGACAGVHWTRDSQNMLWSDAQGIWLRHLNANDPTLILPTAIGEDVPFVPLYQLRDWSLNGRYLLLSIPQIEEVETSVFELVTVETAVLDLVTNELIALPGAIVTDDSGYVVVDWMQDGRLFFIREKNEQGEVAPTLQLWRLTDGQLALEETTALQLPPHQQVQDGVHFITGRFAFTLLADDPLVSGLYVMASSNEQPQRVNGLPFATGNTTWLYDNAGAILAMPGQKDAFVFLGVTPGEGVAYEIRPFLGNRVSHFIWLPR